MAEDGARKGHALGLAAGQGDVAALEALLGAAAAEAVRSTLTAADEDGRAALLHAGRHGRVDTIRMLLDHPYADATVLMMAADKNGFIALMFAAEEGHVDAMRLLLDHPFADAAAMMMLAGHYGEGETALVYAAMNGHVDATRLLLDHPSADAAAMLVHANNCGFTVLMFAAENGHVNAMRLLLDHPSADAAAMMMHASNERYTALMIAAYNGHVDALRLLLNHPSADTAAMMAARSAEGISALTAAAGFAAGQPTNSSRAPTRSCAPLLLLLHRDAVELQPSDAQKAHMTKVMEALCQEVEEEQEEEGEGRMKLFDDDHPNDARDECIRLLLERGAAFFEVPLVCRPVFTRIICNAIALERVPLLLNEAVLGVAFTQQQQQQQAPQHSAA